MSYYEEIRRGRSQRSDRYRSCTLLKDKTTGESFLSTREISEIPRRSTDIYHTVSYNEVGRLDLIAHRYYKNSLLWWVLAQANDIYDPFSDMTPGMSLRVPLLETLYGYNGVLL